MTNSSANSQSIHRITGGVWPAVLTPWTDRDQPDLEAMDQLVELFVRQELGGLYVLGSTGQGPAISVEHRKLITERVAKTNAGRLPLLVHVGAVATVDAVELARHAADCGADGISSVPPIYFPADADITFNHYRLIASATDLPFYPYHLEHMAQAVPSAKEYAQRLLALPNIAGIKYTSCDMFALARLRLFTQNRLTLFSGADALICQAALAGADGAIGTFYNLFGPAFAKVRSEFVAGAFDAAKRFAAAFTTVLERILWPPAATWPFIRAAMRLKYDINIGIGRSPTQLVPYQWDDQDVLQIIQTIDHAAGVE